MATAKPNGQSSSLKSRRGILSSAPATSQPIPEPPYSPSDIPGLGPIRVRALQKAGFETVHALKAASLSTLLKVPGLTEIKARHIQTYLSQFPTLPTSGRKGSDQEGKAPRTANSPAAPTARAEEPSGEPIAELPLTTVRTLGKIVTLLLGAPTDRLRPRLTRELARFTGRAEALIAEIPDLSAKDQERAERRLRDVYDELVTAGAHEVLDKKEQGRLADVLEDACDKLPAKVAAPSRPKA